MHALREQQLAFARALCEGGDAQAARVHADAAFNAEQRLQIYHRNWAMSLRQALAGVYPVIKQLVGDEFFAYAAGAYIEAYPSRCGNIHVFGHAFPSFLQQLAGAESLVYLPDVASLEWAYHAAFHAPEGGVLDIEQLARLLTDQSVGDLAEGGSGSLYLQLSPSCHCVQSEFPVLSIWQQNQDESGDEKIVDIAAGGIQLALVRKSAAIEFHPLSSGAYALLSAVHDGDNFAQACISALETDAECDVGVVLQYCVQQQLITSFKLA